MEALGRSDDGRAVPRQRGQLPLTELGSTAQIGEELSQPQPFTLDRFRGNRPTGVRHDGSQEQ
jgi:hypothetical protein